MLERRVTSRLYEFFYKETPEEREREYVGDLLVQPRTTKEIRAYVLADYLLGRHKGCRNRCSGCASRCIARARASRF